MHICPVCGYPNLDEAPYDQHGCPTYNICPCCGTEFGYDDARSSHARLRERWIANGMSWWSSYLRPPGHWDPASQLKNAALFGD